jgi:hypothetical protein
MPGHARNRDNSEEIVMKRLLLAAAFAVLPVLAFGPTTALAASPSQTECEALGGTLENQQGTKVCVGQEENVGNAPDHSNSQTTQTTVEGQGNLNNKRQEECVGPPGQCK